MELILFVSIVTSIITNIYLVSKVMTVVNVTVPEPVVNVVVEAPEAVALEPVLMEAAGLDYDRLEAMVARLIASQQPVIQPTWIPQPQPYMPQYPNYPPITYGDTTDQIDVGPSNDIQINGISARQFPAR